MFTNRIFDDILFLYLVKIQNHERKVIALESINERVKIFRKQLNLSQEEFGKAIGLSKSGISNIEKGTRNVTNKHIKLICSIFNADELWLTTGTHYTDQLKGQEKEYVRFDTFIKYLESLGYRIDFEKTGESESGYYENETDSTGAIIGQSWVPDKEFYSTIIKNGKSKTILTTEQFEELESNINKMISFELFKHSSN